MKPLSTIRSTALGIGLSALAMAGSAATLGRMQGAALIGRPLDLTVQVQLGDAEDAASPCLEAEVFHADNRQDPSRIRVTFEPGAQPNGGRVRIVSSVPVDEPMVTVYLRAGCSQKSARRYVLLADIVSDVLVAPVVAATSAGATTQLGVEVLKRPPPARPAVRPLPASEPDKARPRKVAKAPSVVQPSHDVKARIAKALATPRLKLDMLDLTHERDPALKASSELLSTPTDSPERRAEAAALWRALNATPEDILRDGARVQAMDADINALKAITERNQLGLKELGTRLIQAESERYANWLVYLLGALLLLSLLALGWLWRRREFPRRGDWWQGSEHGMAAQTSQQPEAADSSRPTLVSQRAGMAPTLAEVDIDLGAPAPAARPMVPARARQATRVAPHAAGTVAPAPRVSVSPGFGLSTGGHLRDVDSQELIDIRHQAEFFMSLGQHDKAIEILEHRLAESGESSPLVFLDLLTILHTLGRKSEYEVVRSEFNRLFTGNMATFAAFSDEGQFLEGYAEVVQRIADLWPSARVLEFMEDCIFRNPGDTSGLTFDMAAYRELLLLHGVAKRIVRGTAAGVESKSAGLMRSPYKSSTFAMPVDTSRRAGANPPSKPDADDAMMHFNLPDPR